MSTETQRRVQEALDALATARAAFEAAPNRADGTLLTSFV